jgi:hypothetical protein
MGINPGKFVEDHREIVAGWSVAPLGGSSPLGSLLTRRWRETDSNRRSLS